MSELPEERVMRFLAVARRKAVCIGGALWRECRQLRWEEVRAHWQKKIKWSLNGLCATYQSEAAFRLEVLCAAILTPLALWLGDDGFERGLLVVAVFWVIALELVNTAAEDLVDLLHPQHHPLAGKIKDAASAAVMVSVVAALWVWGWALWG